MKKFGNLLVSLLSLKRADSLVAIGPVRRGEYVRSRELRVRGVADEIVKRDGMIGCWPGVATNERRERHPHNHNLTGCMRRDDSHTP